MTRLLLPAERLGRWVDNVGARHGAVVLSVGDAVLGGTSPDGTAFTVRLPFASSYDGPADPAACAAAARSAVPVAWGVLLVRKGGFAVARVAGEQVVASKVGQRHVQGRTKAGGQSQQRFARRRDNQARQAYEAAADHAARLLGDLPAASPVVTGGDRAAVAAVLADRRLARLAVVDPWLDVPDPRRAVLEQAVRDASALQVDITDHDPA